MTASLIADVDDVLSTTRAVRRRLDLDRRVPDDVIEQCVELARQAPIAKNVEQCRFVAVRDPELRAGLAALYRRAGNEIVLPRMAAAAREAGKAAKPTAQQRRNMASAMHLTEQLDAVPLLVLAGTIAPPPDEVVGPDASEFYGSVLPTVWSFQLALRSRGLGSSLTSMHLHFADEVAALLDLPDAFTQIALLPVAYTVGTDFRPAERTLPLDAVLHFDRWATTS
ncbi:MAG: nitroreductase family protein [Patulibacter sp.]|nr:nitroreductase family protein [Patulibacter sp.]